jgi:hypothetical protein
MAVLQWVLVELLAQDVRIVVTEATVEVRYEKKPLKLAETG